MVRTRARTSVLSFAEIHPEEVSYLTARALGGRCGVSESTVIRAVQDLGYSGYPQFQEKLREDLSRRRTAIERFAAEDSADLPAQVFARDIENLRTTWDQLSGQSFDRAAGLMAAGSRVWLLGLHAHHAVAVILEEGLSSLGLDARPLGTGRQDIWDEVDRVARGEVVVATAFPRYARLALEAAALAKRRGAHLIALTDGPGSPLAAHADVLLPVSSGLEGHIESLTAAISLAQALLLEVSRKMGSRAVAALRHVESLRMQRGAYWD